MGHTFRASEKTGRAGGSLVIAALVCLVAPAVLDPPARSAVGPRIQCDVREVDFGDVVKGDVVEGRFELRNSGDEMLNIVRVKPG